MNQQYKDIVNKIYNSFRFKFDVPHYDCDDWKQEINFVILKCEKKFRENNESDASFYTYVYKSFVNHLYNLRKKHIFKSHNPCLTNCPFWVVSCKRCISEEIKEHCVDFNKYYNEIRDNVYISRAVDVSLNDQADTLDTGKPTEFINDVIVFASSYGYDFVKVSGLLNSVYNNSSSCKPEEVKELVPIVNQYIEKYGI